MTSLVDSAFSRAGINSKEKFQILKQLEQVITRKTHSLEPSAVKDRAKQMRRELPASVLAELMKIPEQESETSREKQAKKTQEKSFMFAVQSRDDYYSAHVTKNSVPPCGHYNISYSQVDKNKPGPKLVESINTPRRENPPPLEAPAPLKLPKIHRRHIKMIPFSKQCCRKPMASEFEGPHEKRFMVTNLITTFSAKYKCEVCRSSSSPDLSKVMPRGDSLFVTRASAPEYCPNKEALMKDLGRVATFSKMPKRKPFFEIPHLPDPYDVNFHAVKPKCASRSQPSIDFGKKLGRQADPASPLPSFMYVTSSRVALETQTKKAYQMNCTNDSFFTSAGNTSLLGKSLVSPVSGDVSKIIPETKRE